MLGDLALEQRVVRLVERVVGVDVPRVDVLNIVLFQAGALGRLEPLLLERRTPRWAMCFAWKP